MRENIQGNQLSGQLNINKNNIKAQPLESVAYPNDFQLLPMFVFINQHVLYHVQHLYVLIALSFSVSGICYMAASMASPAGLPFPHKLIHLFWEFM